MDPPRTEWLELVDEQGRVTGCARRSACHTNPALLHRVVHVLVVDDRGRLLLQRRAPNKDIQPDKWDTSVGGHVTPGEALEDAARREMREELGITTGTLEFLYQYLWRSDVEREWVTSFLCRHNGAYQFDPVEISACRWWPLAEIDAAHAPSIFTPNLLDELRRYAQWVCSCSTNM